MSSDQKEHLLAYGFRQDWIQKLKDCHQDSVALHLSTLLISVLALPTVRSGSPGLAAPTSVYVQLSCPSFPLPAVEPKS